MRASLLKSSCILLIAFLIYGKTVPAYGQQLPPVFFATGLIMDVHFKDAAIANIIAGKDSEKNAAAVTPKEKKAEDLINYIIKKNATENKEATAANNNTVVTSDSVTVPAIKGNVAASSANTNQIQISANEKPSADGPVSLDEDLDPLINKYAEMISVEPHDISNYPLYRFIDRWYGTPYKWGGVDTAGIDCSAFSQRLYGEIYGMDIVRTAREQHHKSEGIKHYLDAVEGDLIFFRIHRLRISHVGVYLANGYFVHASRSHGIMISSMNDHYWSRRYAGCGHVDREEKMVSESDFQQ